MGRHLLCRICVGPACDAAVREIEVEAILGVLALQRQVGLDVHYDGGADDLIPGGLKTRLYVRTTDSNWKERVAAAAERRPTTLTRTPVDPVSVQLRTVDGKRVIELRPRARSGILSAERSQSRAPGSSRWATAPMNVEEGMYTNDSGQWWFRQFAQRISPTSSA